VQSWETCLAPMAQAIEPVAPPARLWNQIERQLGSRTKSSWSKALGWMAAGAAAAMVAVAVLLPLQGDSTAAYVAVLSDPKTNRPVLVATAERADTVLRVNVLGPAIHVAGRSLELWALPKDGKPRSLGVLSSQERGALKLLAAADQALGDVPTLAISLEPAGGSPSGQPTGPVLYTGPCVKYW
ncbi:MAG TPA: anti-sigma factor, partial [Burkholderiales bacterium]|nr:anti-sigma factor [Burkholderiales bacterium]